MKNSDPGATRTITAELKRLLDELRQIGGTDFLLVLIEHEPVGTNGSPGDPGSHRNAPGTHRTAVDINMTDDHHLLDALSAATDLWRKNNHPN